MKKQIILSTFSSLILTLTTLTALADDVPSSSVQMSKILQNLQSKGYSNVREIEFEEGVYEVKAMTAQGNKIKIYVNPQTGEIINNAKAERNRMSALEVVQKLESAGYHNIYKIESHGHKYEVKAFDQNRKKAELKVDGNTGKISKE
ncbi:MAG: PepSY domain-containing protein [Proteobacteria bacterium]|nr:PepSY domain-containing protein [Pseudomonadota bacterium]